MRDAFPTITNTRWKLLLFVVLGLAFASRSWGIQYGLPFSYWTDEYHEVMRAMELGAGSFNFERSMKGGFYLLLFFEYGIYFLFLKATGAVASTREFAELFVRDPTGFYLIGRATAAVFGCLTVAAVFWLSRIAWSTVAGLLAAAFLAVNVLHVDLSHRIGVDVPMAMLATLALSFGLQLANEGSRSNYVLAAFFAALATTTKMPGVLLLPPLMIAHGYCIARSGGGFRGWLASRNLWWAVGVFLIVLVATNPGVVRHVGLLGPVQSDSVQAVEMEDGELPAESDVVGRPNLYVFYLDVLLDSMGVPLFAVSILAFAYALWRRTPADIVLLSYAVLNYLVISGTASDWLYYPRYTLPIIVVMAALSGRAIADLIGMIPRWRPVAAALIVASLSFWPASRVVTNDIALTGSDTRTLAINWFQANVPAGSKVLIEGAKITPSRLSVQLRESRESLERRLNHWKKAEPRQARFIEIMLAAHKGGGYELELVKLQSLDSLDEYASNGIEYFVVRPDFFVGSRKSDTSAARLLAELRTDPRVTLMRRFEPESVTRPGPVIEIYRLAPPGGNRAE